MSNGILIIWDYAISVLQDSYKVLEHIFHCGIMNEVATVLEVEVAWAMVLSSYEIMLIFGITRFLQVSSEYPRMMLKHTFKWKN